MALLLQQESSQQIQDYLVARDWMPPSTNISVTIAGEGNMNLTLRVQTETGASIILKQSRAWVEKYPDIAAPEQRIAVEAAFYQTIASQSPLSGQDLLASAMPTLIFFDAQNRIAGFEDLGIAADYSFLYQQAELPQHELQQIVQWLSDLHALVVPPQQRAVLQNRDMRQLNYQHIFDLPLAVDNGLNLDEITPGLTGAAQGLVNNFAYKSQVKKLGELYLRDGDCLLHGDFYPGSWLSTAQGVKIIDPEFGFLGCAEFDLGVLIGHLYLAKIDPPDIEKLWQFYQPQGLFSRDLALAFAGVEIMRRLIGVAQLPLNYDLASKKQLLNLSLALVGGIEL